MVSENTDHDDGRIVNDGESDGVTRRDALRAGASLSAAVLAGKYVTGGVAAQTSTTTDGLTGSGTEADPYQIETIDDLDKMRDAPGAHYALTSNIDATPTETWESGAGWDPIQEFTGSLNGRGYTINGLYIDRSAQCALFRKATAVVENVTINADITSQGYKAAIIAAQHQGAGSLTVRDVTLNGTISGGTQVGAITAMRGIETVKRCTIDVSAQSENGAVGLVAGAFDGTMEDCIVNGSITGGATGVGGVVGGNYGTIRGCCVTADIDMGSDSHDVGGVAGINGESGVIEAIDVGGTVATGGNMTGGAVGECLGTIRGVFVDVTVTGSQYVGGVAGFAETPAKIELATSRGSVTGDSQVGGLVGEAIAPIVTNAAARSPVTGGSATGGLIGHLSSNSTNLHSVVVAASVDSTASSAGAVIGNRSYSNSGRVTDPAVSVFWDGDVAGVTGEIGTVGDTIADLDRAATGQMYELTTSEATGDTATGNMPALDFEAVWGVRDGDYPVVESIQSVGCTGANLPSTDDGTGNETTTEEPVPPGGGVTSSQDSVVKWIPLGIAGLLGLGLAADNEEGGE